jgi:predicted component of type VI protein secretion system
MSVSTEPRVSLVGDLAIGQHAIRDLLDRLDQQPDDRAALAEELNACIARYSTTCMESVIHALAGRTRGQHEQQIRLLHSVRRGINQLVDRLRLPDSDPRLTQHVVVALRVLVQERERLELELTLAARCDLLVDEFSSSANGVTFAARTRSLR